MTPLGPFKGLDKRPGISDVTGFLTEAVNLIVRNDGTVIRRPALSFRAALPPDSVSLYAIGEQLRTIAPYNTGDETADDALAPTIYIDYITDPAPRTLTDLLGQVTDSHGRTQALLRYDNNATALHHCQDVGTIPTGTVIGGLGFTPDFSMIRAVGRSWTLDVNFILHYSAVSSYIENAPDARLDDFGQILYPPDNTTSFDLADGAGWEAISQHASGAGYPQALGMFGGRLVVFYRSALLVYQVDVDQSRIFLEQVINGPGTTAAKSVTPLGSDLMFLSEAGVRSISTVTQTLDAREDALGGRIDPLAIQLSLPINSNPVGHYARRLGCYLLAFGQDVLCLSVLPGSGPVGWSTWRLPVPVDAFAEAAGLTWIRSGDSLFALEDGLNQDQTGESTVADIPVLLETVPVRTTEIAAATAVAASSIEPVQVRVIVDGRPGLDINGVPMGRMITLPARSPEPARATTGGLGRTFAVRVYDAAAQSGWRLDNLWLEVNAAGGN